jgi:hypothetical protein
MSITQTALESTSAKETQSRGTYRSMQCTDLQGSIPLPGAENVRQWTLIQQPASPNLHYLQADRDLSLGIYLVPTSHIRPDARGYHLVTVDSPGADMMVYSAMTVHVDSDHGTLSCEVHEKGWNSQAVSLVALIEAEKSAAAASLKV